MLCVAGFPPGRVAASASSIAGIFCGCSESEQRPTGLRNRMSHVGSDVK